MKRAFICGFLGALVLTVAVNAPRAYGQAVGSASLVDILGMLVGQDVTAKSFTATATSGIPIKVNGQLTCAVDFGPGSSDCMGTTPSGYVSLPAGAVFQVGSTLLQDAQMIVVNGYLTLSNSAVRRLDGSPVPLDGGARIVSGSLGTCSAGVEWALRGDNTSGVSTGFRSRLCLCTSDGAGAYAWQNTISGTVGTSTTCAD